MLGNGSFGSVGAASGAVQRLLARQGAQRERADRRAGQNTTGHAGGDGAHRFAVKRGLPVAALNHNLVHHITVSNQTKWVRYRAIIDATSTVARSDDMTDDRSLRAVQQRVNGSAAEDSDESGGEPAPLSAPSSLSMVKHGTVDAITCDYTGQICTGVSSGSILRQSGRMGSSALIGCGCYAENEMSAARDGTEDTHDIISAACSISGCAQDIFEGLWRWCCNELKKPHAQSATREPACLYCIMRRLVVKNQQLLSLASVQSKKRSMNAARSTDTQSNDNGHITGAVSLRVATRAGTAEDR